MKIIIFITAFILNFTICSNAQVSFDWAKSFGGTSSDGIYKCVLDDDGNIYSTGYFTGTVDFDPGPNVFNLTSNGSGDIFVSKLDVAGELKWAISLGSTGADQGIGIALDSANDIIIGGIFTNTVDFNPGTGVANLTSKGGDDFFVLKMDTASNYIWAVSTGGTNNDWINSICTDNSGNIYAAGQFTGTVDFNPGTGTNNTTSKGQWDIFILKLASDGSYTWHKTIGGTSNDIAWRIVTDSSKNVFINGTFQGTVDFDPNSGISNFTSNGGSDIFTLKLDSTGNFKWNNKVGGTGNDEARGIVVDNTGYLYSSGIFLNTVDFNPGTASYNLTSKGSGDIFIQKIDTAGNFIWVKSFGNTGSDGAYDVSMDTALNILVAGFFANTVNFDQGITNYSVTSKGGVDVFALKLDSNSNFMWVKSFGGTGNDCAWCVVDIDFDNSVVAGTFEGVADFNPGSNIYNLTSKGGSDCFIVKFVSCIPLTAIDNQTACDSLVWIDGNTYTSSNNIATHTILGGSVNGCDSIITLNLTINYSTTGTDVQTACDSLVWIDGNTYTLNNNTATHTITGGSVNGCDSIVTLNLTVYTVDTIVNQAGNTLTANAPGAAYQWLDCNNSYAPISSETGQSFTATVNGNYAVEITQNGCTKISDCFPITTVGLEEIKNSSLINLFPNPSGDYINIELPGELQNDNYTICDYSGKSVLSGKAIGENFVIDISMLSAGIYYFRISDNIEQSFKVIKE
jgi:hypothetical protein